MANKNKLQVAFINTAKEFAKLSYAKRLQVGGVLVNDGRIICCSYNGTPKGGDNNCEVTVDGELVTKTEVIHCEENLIVWSARYGIKTEGCSMYLTHSPCMSCSKLIIQSGIKEVYYDREYRLTDSLDFLRKYNIKVERIYDGSI